MNTFFPPNVTSSGTPHTLQSEFSIRDHFAGLAMQGLLSSPKLVNVSYEAVSKDAYLIADAMLEQRSLTND